MATNMARRYGVLLLLLLAFALRVAGLADHNLWWDEGVGVWLARLPVPNLLDWTAHDTHPPLFYLALHAWRRLAGEGEFVWRYPSVVAGLLTVTLVYRLGRALGGRRVGALAALFLALSRFAITWSQEVRMYALAALAATGVLWFALQLWREARWTAWVGYVLCTAGALLSLYLTALVPLVANLAFPLVWFRTGRLRRRLWLWLTAQLAAAALVLPWVHYALPRIPSWSAGEGTVAAGFFLKLYTTTLITGISVDVDAALPTVIAVLVSFTLGLIFLLGRRKSAVQDAGLAMLLLGFLLPPAAVYALTAEWLALYYTPPVAPRYFLPLSGGFYVLLAWGTAAMAQTKSRNSQRRWLATIASGLILVAALTGLASFYPGRARTDDYLTLAHILNAHRRADDAVVLYTDKDWPVFSAHYTGAWSPIPNGATADEATLQTWLLPVWERSTGIWLATTPDARRMDPQGAIPALLRSKAVTATTWLAHENSLTFYARAPERAATQGALAPDFAPPDGPAHTFAGGAQLSGAHLPLRAYHTGERVFLSLFWASPPASPFTITLSGPADHTLAVAAPAATPEGPAHQLVPLLLPAGLPSGEYDLELALSPEDRFRVVRLEVLPEARRTHPDSERVDIGFPMERRLGDAIQFLGYDLAEDTLSPGDTVDLTLYWQTTAPLEQRYKVFTHIRGEIFNAATGNFLWGQRDNEPVENQYPTTSWLPGEIIADPYAIPLPHNAPPGRYLLQIGLYGLVDGARLPVYDADGIPVGDAITIAELAIR